MIEVIEIRNLSGPVAKMLIVIVCILVASFPSNAQVGIGVPAPHPKSILDLDATSNDKGLLVPAVNSAEREILGNTGSPAPDGLLVYDEEQKAFYFWNAGLATPRWQALNPFTYRKGSGATDEENFVISLTNNKSVVIGTVGSPAKNLEIGGDVRASANVSSSTINTSSDISTSGKFVGFGMIPLGGIMMWSGDVVNIPAGWALCNGQTSNGITTPDLSGRFIVGEGTSPAGPTNYVMRTSGGEERHVLTANQLPAHSHGGSTSSAGTHNHTYSRQDGGEGYVLVFNDSDEVYRWDTHASFDTDETGAHTHTISSQGGGQAHENRPPYFVLAYIMRVQ